MLVAASISVGNAVAETTEGPAAAQQAAVVLPEIAVPAQPVLAEPAAPAAAAVEAPVKPAPIEPAAPAPVVGPVEDVSVSVTAAPAEAAPAPVEATAIVEGAAGADGASANATTETVPPIAPRAHQPNHRDPCEGAPSGAYQSGGACKINVCHATGSQSNPYVFISPNWTSANGHGHEGHGGDVIGVSSAADCPDGTTDPCEGEDQDGAYSDGNNCVVDICHATGSASNPYTSITVSTNGLNGHGDHGGDIIPAPAGGCPAGPPDACPEPGYQPPGTECDEDPVCPAPSFPQGGSCKINICHATGSSTNPFVFITVNVNGLEGHGDHEGDIIGVSSEADCVPPTDACPGLLNPGNQPAGTICIVDACPDQLNPGNQPIGTVCIVDACPDALNPGNQPIGTVCIVDACPDALNPGNQLPGTVCLVATPPAPEAAPTPVGPEPSVPVQEPVIVTPVVDVEEDELIPVLDSQDEPVEAVAGVSDAPDGELPFTGAQTFSLTMLGLLAFLAGAGLVRRRPRRTN